MRAGLGEGHGMISAGMGTLGAIAEVDSLASRTGGCQGSVAALTQALLWSQRAHVDLHGLLQVCRNCGTLPDALQDVGSSCPTREASPWSPLRERRAVTLGGVQF